MVMLPNSSSLLAIRRLSSPHISLKQWTANCRNHRVPALLPRAHVGPALLPRSPYPKVKLTIIRYAFRSGSVDEVRR